MTILAYFKPSLLILAVLILTVSKSFAQPIRDLRSLELAVYDGKKLIKSSDTNYFFLTKFHGDTAFYNYEFFPGDSIVRIYWLAKDEFCNKVTTIIIFKKSTAERMILNSVGCGTKKINFKEGEFDIKD